MGTVASRLIENSYVRNIFKFMLHLFFRQCQIARICLETNRGIVAFESDTDDIDFGRSNTDPKSITRPEDSMVWRFAVSIYRSKQLKTEKSLLFSVPFNINHVIKQIFLKKSINEHIHSPILRENLTYCLQLLNWVNVMVDHATALQQLSYSDANIKHVMLLEALWRNMMPDVVRRNTEPKVNGQDCPLSPVPPYQPLVSADWGEVGFQGKDPTTDLRGMGIYGLLQLVHLSNVERGFRARKMLFESRHPRRYFPFAASGINITAFVLNDLLRGRRLHSALFQCIHNTLHNSSINVSTATSKRASGKGYGSTGDTLSPRKTGALEDPSLDASLRCSSADADDEQYYQCEGGSPVHSSSSGALSQRGVSPELFQSTVTDTDTDADVLLAQFHSLDRTVMATNPAGKSPSRAQSGGPGSADDSHLHAHVHTPQVLLQACMNTINDVYVETYELFFDEWIADDPPNIMAFQRIFGLTKDKITAKYKALQ